MFENVALTFNNIPQRICRTTELPMWEALSLATKIIPYNKEQFNVFNAVLDLPIENAIERELEEIDMMSILQIFIQEMDNVKK